MKKQICNCLLTLLATISTFQLNIAQDLDTNQKIDNWFLEQRFILADKNDDALLERKEMQSFANEFSYFLIERYYSASDANKDGYLSFGNVCQKKI